MTEISKLLFLKKRSFHFCSFFSPRVDMAVVVAALEVNLENKCRELSGLGLINKRLSMCTSFYCVPLSADVVLQDDVLSAVQMSCTI